MLSDGERACFHLIVQIITAPPETIIIIDEPNSYLHSSLKSQIWLKLLERRNDCKFIFISHDLHFIRFLTDFKIIFSKSVEFRKEDNINEIKWIWEEISYDINKPFPKIILQQLGYPERKILFIEGEMHSLDYKLFSYLYPDYQIISKKSCEIILHSVISLQSYELFDDSYKFIGLIDRDYRSQEDLDYFQTRNIFSLEVAEIENLFITPEITELIATRIGKDWENDVNISYEETIEERFQAEKSTQLKNAVEYQINSKSMKWQLQTKDSTQFKRHFEDYIQTINVQEIIDNLNSKYNSASSIIEYLKLLNSKGLVTQIAHLLGLDSAKSYYDAVLADLKENPSHIDCFAKYIPNLT